MDRLYPIKEEDLIFTDGCDTDRVCTSLNLEDYDWMNYSLSADFNTRDQGYLAVTFVYFGNTESQMKVKQYRDNSMTERVFTYSTDIFQKYIIRFLAEQIAAWGQKYAFYGQDTVIDFYNEVLSQQRQSLSEC